MPSLKIMNFSPSVTWNQAQEMGVGVVFKNGKMVNNGAQD